MVPIWIVTTSGYFSFITDKHDPNYLWIRARVKEHLEENFPGIKAEEFPGADYFYRAKVRREDVAMRIAEMVMDSRVTAHFKDVAIKTAAPGQFGSFRTALYSFWTNMAALQPYAPYSKVPRKMWVPPKALPGTKGKYTAGSGQQTISFTGSAVYGRDFNWDAYDLGPANPHPYAYGPVDPFEDDAWDALSPEEQTEFLDQEEEALREAELTEGWPPAPVEDYYPAPPAGSRRKNRRRARKNRKNQK